MSRARTGRPPTGSIVYFDPKTKTKPRGVRVTRANGKREIIPIKPGTTAAAAVALAPVVADQARFAVGELEGETVSQYADRWCKWRAEDLKLESARNDRPVVAAYLGGLTATPIASVKRDDLETIRDLIDARVRKGEIGWKAGRNHWGTIAKLFRDATRSKRRDLRVLEHNPAADIEGPDRGGERAKPILWPAMFLAFVRDDRILLAWRRLLALSVYLYARPEEIAALEWEDVRLEEGVVLVHRAVSMRAKDKGRTKPTKTKNPRRVPIEPTLRPLLEAMREEQGGAKATGRVTKMPPQSQLARVFRDYLRAALELACVEAGDVFTSDETRMQIDWRRATRDAGISWRAMRGDSPIKIMRAAGHKNMQTTMRYVNEAEGMAANAEVFPVLPTALLAAGKGAATFARTRDYVRGVSASVSAFRRRQNHEASQKGSNGVGAAGFEPATSTV